MAVDVRRAAAAALAGLLLLPAIRVASTYRVFSQTVDEPIHLAAGFQWLRSGRYDLDREHPPLARIGFALDAYLSGARVDESQPRTIQGNELLYRHDRYERNLARMRVANLPFFLLALVVIFAWARRLFDRGTAILAVALFGSLPPVLGHAGLATTDMPTTATTVFALFTAARWLDRPSWPRALTLGLATAAGLLTKFSFLIFFPAGLLVLIVARVLMRQRIPVRLAQFGTIAAIAIVLLWAAYRFDTGTMREARLRMFPMYGPHATAARYAAVPGYEWVRPDLIIRYNKFAHTPGNKGADFVDWAKSEGYPSPLAGRSGHDTMIGAPRLERSLADAIREPFRRAAQRVVMMPIPAPEFFVGAEFVRNHVSSGHTAFLFGERSTGGWWYYFPVVLFFKTPLPFVLLSLAGIAALACRCWRLRDPEGLAVSIAPLAMLAPALTSGLNVGVRHVLPLYPLLTLCAAFATAALWRWRKKWVGRAAVVLLLVWYFGGAAAAHPDYLAYFNELAGSRPDRIAVDSNLDWGQDLLRLRANMRRSDLKGIHVAYFGSADWRRFVPVEALPPSTCMEGWIAISEMELLVGGPAYSEAAYGWLRAHTPVRQIGKSIRLYWIRPGTCKGRM